jgi:hypothetical protein
MAIAITPRSIGLTLVAAMTAAWLETNPSPSVPPASESNRPSQSSRASGGRRAFALTADAVPNTDKLRGHMAERPTPGRGRNPFVYGPRTPSGSTAMREREGEREVMPLPPAEPPMPVFRLSGIASNAENGGVVLTAILIDNGSMVFAKAGDKLSNGYSVVRVEEMSVTLVDASGVTQTIRLP